MREVKVEELSPCEAFVQIGLVWDVGQHLARGDAIADHVVAGNGNGAAHQASSRPVHILMVVVLPAPLGPRKACTCPAAISSERLPTAPSGHQSVW